MQYGTGMNELSPVGPKAKRKTGTDFSYYPNQRNILQTKILENENCYCADQYEERFFFFALHTTVRLAEVGE